jgi:hypothetical protein
MSDQRMARRRRREERRAAVAPAVEPKKRSPLSAALDWLQHNALIVGGVALGVIFLGVLVYALIGAAGSEDQTSTEAAEEAEADDSADLPGQFLESEGRQHVNEDVEYQSDPPTSGPHNPVPLVAGVYRDEAQAVEERAVHFMEHAGVAIWYNCEAGDLDEAECNEFVDGLVEKYEDLLRGQSGAGLLILNNPGQEHFLAVTGWTRLLELDEYDEEAVDEFIDVHRCRFDPEGFCD